MRWQHSRHIDREGSSSTPPLSRGGSAHQLPSPVSSSNVVRTSASADADQHASNGSRERAINVQNVESPTCAVPGPPASPSSPANFAASPMDESASPNAAPAANDCVESAQLLCRTRQRCHDVRAQLANVELAIRRLLPPPVESESPAYSSSSYDARLDTLEFWSSELESSLRALHAAESKLRGLQLRLKSYGGLVATVSIPEVEHHLLSLGLSPNHHHGTGADGGGSRGSGGIPRVASANSFLSLIASHARVENAAPSKPFPFGRRDGSPVRQRSASSAPHVIAVISRSEAGSPPRRGILKSSSAASLAHSSSPRSLKFACPSSADEDHGTEPQIKHAPHLLASTSAKRSSPLVSPTDEDSPLFQSNPGLFSAAHLHHVQTSSASSSPRSMSPVTAASGAASHLAVVPLALPPPQHAPRVTPPGSPRREHAPLPLPPPPQCQRAPRAGLSSSTGGGISTDRARTGSLTPSEDASRLAEHAAIMDDASFLRLIRSLDMFAGSAGAAEEIAGSGGNSSESGSAPQSAPVASEAAAAMAGGEQVTHSPEEASGAMPPCIIL